jgi:hypothetical protein
VRKRERDRERAERERERERAERARGRERRGINRRNATAPSRHEDSVLFEKEKSFT